MPLPCRAAVPIVVETPGCVEPPRERLAHRVLTVSSMELAYRPNGSSSEASWSPVIFDIRCAFRWRAQPEPGGREAMLFVEPASGMVLLVRVKLQSVGVQRLGQEDKTRPPTFSPLDGIDEHPVDVCTGHGQEGDDLAIACPYPDVAARANHFPKDIAGSFQREFLPGWEVRVGCLSCTVPHANDRGLIPILERPDRCARIIQGGTRRHADVRLTGSIQVRTIREGAGPVRIMRPSGRWG